MEYWLKEYKSKLRTPRDAVAVVKSGQTVYVSGNAATPTELLKTLIEQKGGLRDVRLAHVLLLGKDLVAEGNDAFRHLSFFVGEADRKAVNQGKADYIPVFLHEIPSLFASRKVSLDAAVVQTSPPDNNGFVSLGVEVLASKAAIRHIKAVLSK